jgi:hypothetical protein
MNRKRPAIHKEIHTPKIICKNYFQEGFLYIFNIYTTGDTDVPGDVLKLLGENGLKLMTQLINNTYETRE